MSRVRLPILLATATPDDLPALRPGRKARTLRRRLSPLIEGGQVTLAVEPAVRADRLPRLLRLHRPRVLHIACHAVARGDQRVLALEDRRGSRDELTALELAAILRHNGSTTTVVILEACETEEIAKALWSQDEDRVVIGARERIEPRAATRFFLSFHEALANGVPIATAFYEARRDMELFAPSLWAIPVLFGKPEVLSKPLGEPPSPSSFEIGASHVEDFVTVSGELEASAEVYGRDQVLRVLDEHWFEENGKARETSNIVHLRGRAGVGKTAILARWLEMQASRWWCGATRVFAWSFDPLGKGLATGNVASFFRQAFEFFGGLDPYLKPGAGEASQEGEWLEGLRLARIIRHERVLLCLDGIPTLPHRERSSYEPHEVLTPGLAALLHEISRGHAGLCVVTSRLPGSFQLDETHDVPIGGLEFEDALEFLTDREVIEPRNRLASLAKELCKDPLALSLVARALARGLESSSLQADSSSLLERLGVTDDSVAMWWLRAMALRGGSLDGHELCRVRGRPRPKEPWSWGVLEPEDRAALRFLQRCGLIEILPSHTVALAHSALLESIPVGLMPRTKDLVAHSLRALRGTRRGLEDVPAFVRTLRVALCSGQAEQAYRCYKDDVCHLDEDGYERNHLTRKLGAIGESVCVLAELFERNTDGSIGQSLHPALEALEATDVDLGLLHHHLGLAMRHLGRLPEAAERLEAAFDRYRDQPERAATCANDLAEVHLWLECLPKATLWAERAVERAVEARDIEPGLLQKAAVFGTLATRAHVKHLSGDLDGAEADFEEATAGVEKLQRLGTREVRRLFSRPGYYSWCFLLDELERMAAKGCSNASLQNEVTALAQKLDDAQMWHRNTANVALVSRGLDAIARGRLLVFCHTHDLECPTRLQHGGTGLLEWAFESLGFAVHIFRASQHLWMLPHALRARIAVYEALGDQVGATLDEHEARTLERAMGVPLKGLDPRVRPSARGGIPVS